MHTPLFAHAAVARHLRGVRGRGAGQVRQSVVLTLIREGVIIACPLGGKRVDVPVRIGAAYADGLTGYVCPIGPW